MRVGQDGDIVRIGKFEFEFASRIDPQRIQGFQIRSEAFSGDKPISFSR